MNFIDLVKQRRTIRRFQQKPIAPELLGQLIDAARLAPSGSNLQPCEFIVVNKPETVAQLFLHTRWAGYLPPEQGFPPPDQRPVAFVVVLLNREIRATGGEHDVAAAVMNMMYLALENGIGSCWIGSVDRKAVRELLQIPEKPEIDSVLALGYPDETPIIEKMTDSVKYYKDNQGRLHVPKRSLDQVLHWNEY